VYVSQVPYLGVDDGVLVMINAEGRLQVVERQGHMVGALWAIV
jgi:hypothetical protein